MPCDDGFMCKSRSRLAGSAPLCGIPCASVRKHEYFSRQVRQEYPLSLITVAERLLVAGSRKVTHGCLRSLMVTKNNL